MPQSSATRQRPGNRVNRKDGGHSVSTPQEVTLSPGGSQDEINRLRDQIDRLQRDRRVSERETGDGFTLTAELRWKLNQLEKEKLQFTSKCNEEVSQYEAQVARLRAQVERGEAQRQTLEYDVAVARRDVAVERRKSEEKMRDLRGHNLKLEGVVSELHQRACDVQRSLEITQKAREDDHQDLQTQLHERDRLLLNANAENHRLHADQSRLETLIQEQTDTLHQMEEEMERMESERESDREKLKNTSADVQRSTDREDKLRADLQSALEKVKVLEQNFESERVAHLESRLNSDIMQVKVKDLEDALGLEKSSHADLVSRLEMLKQKLSEVERAYTREKDQSQHVTHKLTQMEKDHINMKTDLIGQLDQEKARAADLIGQLEKLSVRLQEQERECTERLQQINQVQRSLVCVQQSYDGVLCDIVELLQEYQQQGAAHTHHTEGDKPNASALLDILRRTLHNYKTQLQESVVVMQKLTHEMLVKDEKITELQKNIQECEAQCVCVNKEVKRLRVCVADAAADVDRAQKDLRRLTHQLQDEKTQHTHTQTQMNTLQQQHQRDSQEKLSFLHVLYQRLVAGCVLVTPAHSMLGSFSWGELSAMVQEHVDTLTSDLTAAIQKVSRLESVCEGQSAALERVSDQLKQREEMWRRQRQDLNTHHTHTISQLQHTIQDLRRQLEVAEGRVLCLERSQSEQEQEVRRLQESCLLAACGVLAGCMRALRRHVCVLMWQKAMLQERVCEAEILRTDVNTLLHALTDAGVKGQPEAIGRAARRFRRCVIAVLAAGRLRALGRSSSVLFRVAVGYGRQPDVCVSDVMVREEEEDEDHRVVKTLNSSELLVLIHTCMEGIHQELRGTDSVMSAVESRCKKLFERLLSDVDAQCWDNGKASLARRLGLGLHKLTSDQHAVHGYTNSKVLVASLQKHILQFTQRLHSAEVERRNLRLQLSRIYRKDTHTACVPVQRFESVCSELRSALEREQCAQRLLHDQATQLQRLDVSMQRHTGEQLINNQTLAHAVQSLSDTKRELKRKDQCLRSLEKHFNQSQQEKNQLQQTVKSAEEALSTAAKNKESLMSYIRSVEDYLKEMRDDIIQCRGHVTLLLPDPPSIIRNPQTDACQSLVRCFLELFQLMVLKISSQGQDLSSPHS
ncbi:coiled-coil domain-containing protein 171-like isoform X1 [Triplophysa rosa]|uniref:coiled-coil domain-containing protein 171-like isoform X1 n=1 Tax=Triplophysa rosa TaxID=992332 RepID=UPI002545F2FB|nr:coiled-coil domain-containing protein 171-like isoform X1 [Triplophysa rosa]